MNGLSDDAAALLRPYGKVVLAVSGGGDSLGMLLMMAALPNRPDCVVATVDHGLQAQSEAVAQHVVAVAGRLGFEAAILRWEGEKPASGVQEAARHARYRLLADLARAKRAQAIVTAHTADDNRETLIMRLLRGSGPEGLAAMQAVRMLEGGLALVRPCLGLTRTALRDLCHKNGLTPVDDPANENRAFTRVRLRQLMPLLEAEGFTLERAGLLAERLAKQNAAVEEMGARLLCTSRTNQGHDLKPWLHEPVAICAAALKALLRQCGQADLPEKLAAVEALLADLLAATRAGRRHRATLRGAMVSLTAKGVLSLALAPPRRKIGSQ